MTDWKRYWNTAPAAWGEHEYLRQVGKTVHGRPVPEESLDRMVADVVDRLDLGPGDRLLDLCCGNGLLTARFAAVCAHVTGVDYSAPLIDVARRRFARPNLEYVHADAAALPPEVAGRPFSKVCMYEALQHFTVEAADAVLRGVRASGARGAPVLLASVPDRTRLWSFYDTPERRREYERRVQEDTEPIGHWWTPEEMTSLGERRGYRVQLLPPHPSLHVAHYRFDALLTP